MEVVLRQVNEKHVQQQYVSISRRNACFLQKIVILFRIESIQIGGRKIKLLSAEQQIVVMLKNVRLDICKKRGDALGDEVRVRNEGATSDLHAA